MHPRNTLTQLFQIAEHGFSEDNNVRRMDEQLHTVLQPIDLLFYTTPKMDTGSHAMFVRSLY